MLGRSGALDTQLDRALRCLVFTFSRGTGLIGSKMNMDGQTENAGRFSHDVNI